MSPYAVFWQHLIEKCMHLFWNFKTSIFIISWKWWRHITVYVIKYFYTPSALRPPRISQGPFTNHEDMVGGRGRECFPNVHFCTTKLFNSSFIEVDTFNTFNEKQRIRFRKIWSYCIWFSTLKIRCSWLPIGLQNCSRLCNQTHGSGRMNYLIKNPS